jgi:hypothetical protein
MTLAIIWLIIIGCVVLKETQLYQDEIAEYLAKASVKRVKSEAQRFYSSNAWHKAKREVRGLQMEVSGLEFVYCEDCGITSKDIDNSGKPIVMSIGHDKARSTHKHLALVIDNLFNQCLFCNKAQGINDRQLTGYNVSER